MQDKNVVYYCNIDRVEDLNKRISSRNIPDNSLKPNFSIRPQSTKMSIFPILDFKTKPNVYLHYYKNNAPGETFNPGTSNGQFSAYAKNINNESILQNRIYAKQRCEQANYVPGMNSDLYVPRLDRNSEDTTQPFPGLFEKPAIPYRDENTINYLNKPIHNFTRYQRISQCGKN